MSRIIVAIDSKIFLPVIFDYLASLATNDQLIVKIVHALEPEVMNETWPSEELRIEGEELLASIVEEFKHRFPNVKVESALVIGDPKEVILDEASLWLADMIVMGSHGRRGVNRFLLGSVSAAVSTHAHCSVIILRTPPEKLENPMHLTRNTEAKSELLHRPPPARN